VEAVLSAIAAGTCVSRDASARMLRALEAQQMVPQPLDRRRGRRRREPRRAPRHPADRHADEIIEKIRSLQWAISLEMIVIHMFYGGMPRAKAEKSLRLFAEKVLPAVQAMPTLVNPASVGQPNR
jgi:hypothetical protein